MFHHLDFPRLFLCESTGYSKHKTIGIASVAICGGSNHILTGLVPLINVKGEHSNIWMKIHKIEHNILQLSLRKDSW